jgi:predicted RNase H-like nuclease (RuvC/YqgF family)
MIDDTAIAALQRSLSENREAKRKIKTRLAELEAEAEMLRSQLATFNAVIEQTERALRRVLFPDDKVSSFDPVELRASEAEFEAEVAKIERTEQSSNVRFNDFRIPQAATVVLREANKPLHVSEIYRRMADGGYEFRGQHQLITLAVSLSRSKRFRKVAPGTFELNPDYQAGQVA